MFLLIFYLQWGFALSGDLPADSSLIRFRFLMDNAQYDKALRMIQTDSALSHDVKLLLKTEIARKQRNTKQADSLFRLIDKEHLPDSGLIAEYYLKKGQLGKNPQQGKNWIIKAIDIKKSHRDGGITTLSDFYNSLAIRYYRLKAADSAIKYYRLAIDSFDKTHPFSRPKDVASYHQNLGIMYASRQEFEKALAYFKFSIIELQKDPLLADQLAINYANLARLFLITGISDSARHYYKKAEKLKVKNNSDTDLRLAQLYNNIGNLYSGISDFEKAGSYYKKAKNIFDLTNQPPDYFYYIILSNLAFVYQNTGDFATAKKYYRMALKSDNPVTKSRSYRNLANIFRKENMQDSAIYNYHKSITSINHQNKKLQDQYNLAFSYLYYGDFLGEETNRQAEALSYLKKANQMLIKLYGYLNRDVSRSYYFLSKYYEKNHQLEPALQEIQLALSSLIKNIDDSNISSNPKQKDLISDNHLISVLSQKSILLYKIGLTDNNLTYLDLSLETFELTIALIEKIRTEYDYESNKLLLAEKSDQEYNKIMQLLTELVVLSDNPIYLKKLFSYMEKSKAAILLSAIKDNEAMISAHVDKDLLDKTKLTLAKLHGYKNLIYEEEQKGSDKNTKKITDWQNKIFHYQHQYDSIKEIIKANYPKYYDLSIAPTTLEMDSVIAQLKKNEVLIEYTILEDQLLIMALTPEKQLFKKINLDSKTLNQWIDEIRSTLVIEQFANFDREKYNTFVSSSQQLYQNLLKPVESVIAGKNLIIIPDEKLGYVPFEILLTEKSTKMGKYERQDYKVLPYLIKKHATKYAYSASLMYYDNPTTRPRKKKVMSFAPSYNMVNQTVIDSLFTHRQSTDLLLPIPGVEKEIKNIGRVFNSDTWTGDEATEQNFNNKSSDYAILHLAMHTIIDDANPMFSKLVFHQGPGNKAENLLNTYELFGLNLHAEMAVLSACNTGYGKLQKGEGIMSLARGFLYAGISDIVMTLWPIEDYATSDLMYLFYKNLADGMPKNIALRKAKLDFLENSDMLRAHPHFWASFVNIGPSVSLRYIKEKSLMPMWLWALTGVVVIAAGFFIFLRRRK
jgi:CHAT domain-containing protein/tetratricopeptide (TPR) repeat protein